MSASTHNQPRYYGSFLNLEHRILSGAVLTLAAFVLVLFGEEGRAVPGSVDVPVATVEDYHGEPAGWVRPVEIRVHAPDQAGPSDVGAIPLGESLTPVPLQAPAAPTMGPITR